MNFPTFEMMGDFERVSAAYTEADNDTVPSSLSNRLVHESTALLAGLSGTAPCRAGPFAYVFRSIPNLFGVVACCDELFQL